MIPKQNPKSEVPNPKQTENVHNQKANIEIRNEIVWHFAFFDHLDLFRISEFEF